MVLANDADPGMAPDGGGCLWACPRAGERDREVSGGRRDEYSTKWLIQFRKKKSLPHDPR